MSHRNTVPIESRGLLDAASRLSDDWVLHVTLVQWLLTSLSVAVVLWWCYTRGWLGAVTRFVAALDAYLHSVRGAIASNFLIPQLQALQGKKIVLFTGDDTATELIPHLREAVFLYAPRDPCFDFDSASLEDVTAASVIIVCWNSRRGLPAALRRFRVELPYVASEFPDAESIVIEELRHPEQLLPLSGVVPEPRRPGPITVVSVHVTPDGDHVTPRPGAQLHAKVDTWIRSVNFNRFAIRFRGGEVLATAWRDDILPGSIQTFSWPALD